MVYVVTALVGSVNCSDTETLAPGARLEGVAMIYGLPSGAAHVVAPDALKSVEVLFSASSTNAIGPVMLAELVFVSVTV